VTAVLAWQPDPPEASPGPEEALDTTPTPVTPRDKKKSKKGFVKKEPKAIEKRPISAGSAERNISAKRLPIGQPNVRTRAAIVKEDQDPIKEEEQGPNDDEELHELEDILQNAGKKM
jgi:hypothetical protein